MRLEEELLLIVANKGESARGRRVDFMVKLIDL